MILYYDNGIKIYGTPPPLTKENLIAGCSVSKIKEKPRYMLVWRKDGLVARIPKAEWHRTVEYWDERRIVYRINR